MIERPIEEPLSKSSFLQRGASRYLSKYYVAMAEGTFGTFCHGDLLLRPMRDTDICDAYLDTLNDTKYMRLSRQSAWSHSVQSAVEYMAQLRNTCGELIASLDRPSGQLVGTVSVRFAGTGTEAHMGLLTLREFQGTGRGMQSWCAVLEKVLAIPIIEVVYAGTHVDNHAMQSILSRSGFERRPPTSTDGSNRFYFKTKPLQGAIDRDGAKRGGGTATSH